MAELLGVSGHLLAHSMTLLRAGHSPDAVSQMGRVLNEGVACFTWEDYIVWVLGRGHCLGVLGIPVLGAWCLKNPTNTTTTTTLTARHETLTACTAACGG